MRLKKSKWQGDLKETTRLPSFSLPESIMELSSVVFAFESVDKILWCDHLNESSLAVLLHDTICFSIFYKMKFGIFFLHFDCWHPWE